MFQVQSINVLRGQPGTTQNLHAIATIAVWEGYDFWQYY